VEAGVRCALAALLVWCATAGSAAARSLAIERFDAEVTVTAEGDVYVRETIRPRFTGAWNGIYRSIPVEYRTPQGFGYRLLLDPTAVTDGQGSPLRYTVARERHYQKLMIWVPDARDATRTVVLGYAVQNALKFFTDHDELYWNVTGDEWEVPIEAVAARIRLPAGATGLRALAFTGAYGSREREADVAIDGGEVAVRMRRSLAFREGLTVVVGWDKGIVAEPTALGRGLLFLQANWPLGAPIAVRAMMLALWRLEGRDPRLRPIAVRYEPPDGLSPAEAGTLTDDSADVRDVTATLVDLAVRGFLVIEEKEEPGLLWSGRTYTLRRTKPPGEWGSLRPHERVLLQGVFEDGREEASLADLENSFYKRLASVREGILKALLGRGCYAARPDRVRLAYRIAAAVVAGLGLVAAGWGGGRSPRRSARTGGARRGRGSSPARSCTPSRASCRPARRAAPACSRRSSASRSS
jgi:hypothetical protein